MLETQNHPFKTRVLILLRFWKRTKSKKAKTKVKEERCSRFHKKKHTHRKSDGGGVRPRICMYSTSGHLWFTGCRVTRWHIRASIHGNGRWKAQHRDPRTLNGVGVKGLVGERRRKSLLWLSPSYGEDKKGNFNRQHRSDRSSQRRVPALRRQHISSLWWKLFFFYWIYFNAVSDTYWNLTTNTTTLIGALRAR